MNIPFDLTDLESKALTDPDLQASVKAFTYFPGLVDWLLRPAGDAAILRKLIENTRAVVPRERTMGWKEQLAREDNADGVRPEDRWERTIWRKWRPFPNKMPKTPFHALAPYILSYQVPLYGKQDSEGWGKIDLIGVSREHLPVVIEVKAEQSSESPLALVLEAARYGVALREMWNCGFREEWIAELQKLELPSQPLPMQLEKCQLICAAPSEYWKRRGPKTTSGDKYQQAWGPFRNQLCAKLAEHHLPVEFVELEFSAKTLSCE